MPACMVSNLATCCNRVFFITTAIGCSEAWRSLADCIAGRGCTFHKWIKDLVPSLGFTSATAGTCTAIVDELNSIKQTTGASRWGGAEEGRLPRSREPPPSRHF